jgi:hypothetical protein
MGDCSSIADRRCERESPRVSQRHKRGEPLVYSASGICASHGADGFAQLAADRPHIGRARKSVNSESSRARSHSQQREEAEETATLRENLGKMLKMLTEEGATDVVGWEQ